MKGGTQSIYRSPKEAVMLSCTCEVSSKDISRKTVLVKKRKRRDGLSRGFCKRQASQMIKQIKRSWEDENHAGMLASLSRSNNVDSRLGSPSKNPIQYIKTKHNSNIIKVLRIEAARMLFSIRIRTFVSASNRALVSIDECLLRLVGPRFPGLAK